MKKILLPTDFSNISLNSAFFACNFFGENAEYHIYHAYGSVRKRSNMLISIEDIIKNDAKAGLNSFLTLLQEKFPKIQFYSHLMDGDLNDYINEYVANHNIDYVFMGTKGAGGLSGKLFGSNTTALIQSSKVPVFAIPDEVEPDSFECNTAAIAVGSFIEKNVQNYQSILSQIFTNSELTKMNAFSVYNDENDKDFNYQGICTTLNVEKDNFEWVKSDDIDRGIEKYIYAKKPDILIMIRSNSNFFKRIFQASHTKNIALGIEIPLLVLPPLD